ncbi:hypothetical protein [Variovorax sp. YR752]|uniref:hypothetical protein n=1 Tax=Variovorax sp. YR752 TaxID=1884383 RepID=UPI0031383B4B
MPAAEAKPIACTLDPQAMGSRLAWIRGVTERSLLAHRHEGRELRLVYRPDAADELRRIVNLERDCCAFLDFALEATATEMVLTITSPADTEPDAQRLFAQFLPAARPAAPACGCKGGCG